MKLKNYLEKRIYGWLPKEPNFASGKLKTKEHIIKLRRRKPPTIRDRLVGGLGGGGLALVLMGIFFYFLFSWYPKSFILTEELVGTVLLVLAFFIWITGKNKNKNGKMATQTF